MPNKSCQSQPLVGSTWNGINISWSWICTFNRISPMAGDRSPLKPMRSSLLELRVGFPSFSQVIWDMRLHVAPELVMAFTVQLVWLLSNWSWIRKGGTSFELLRLTTYTCDSLLYFILCFLCWASSWASLFNASRACFLVFARWICSSIGWVKGS